MKSSELRPEVADLTRRIESLLQNPLQRDAEKLRSLTESILDEFDAMKDDAKSQAFSFLVGVCWALPAKYFGDSTGTCT